MSKSEDIDVRRESLELVRLKVDGASSIVNTIRDQQTARGLSLVCPFPALEAAIPVSFGDGGEAKMRRGTIHRIGVEDDPETGLPRLRLSVRAHETRSTVVAPPAEDLIEESIRAAEDSDADTDLDLSTPSFDVVMGLETDVDGGVEPDEEAILVPELEADPAWVGCDELPLPEEFLQRMRTRRRRKLTGIAAWSTVIVVLVAGAYTLATSDAVNIVAVRDYLSEIIGYSGDGTFDAIADAEAVTESVEAASPAEVPAEAPAEVPEVVATVEEAEISEMDAVPESLEESTPAAAGAVVEQASEEVADIAPAEEADEEQPPNTPDDVTILLPTRWRAEYANAYRLRDPNGVVVDVPGGLVRREGWIEAGKDHPMIRSVKAVQRETGARFIVFVHGELPRYVTAAKPGGVALRLVRETADQPGAAEQVAMLP